MYPYMFPPPPYGYAPGPAPMRGKDKEAVRLAKQILRDHKAEKKRKRLDEKKKEAKNKPKMFTLLETWGLLMLCSIPMTLTQIWLLDYVQHVLNTVFHAAH